MNKKNMKSRLRSVRKSMKDAGLDALIVSTGANVRYVSGFGGDDSWAVITSRVVYLITDSRYTEQAEGECGDVKIIDRKGPITAAAADVLNRLKSVQKTGIEDKISVKAFYDIRKKIAGSVKKTSNFIENIRRDKDDSEVKAVKKAGKVAVEALGKTLAAVRVGMSENELAGLLEFNIRKLGFTASFDTIVAFGANGSMPHYMPGRRKLKKIDTILIDWGVRCDGYCSDLTRCFVVGKARKNYLAAFSTVRKAQRSAIAKIRSGVKVAEVEQAARDVLKRAGLPQYGHGTGHGLGLDVHEQPIVSERLKKERLKVGDIITIEPGVYMPGKVGIRLEDDVLVTETGGKVLTPAEFGGDAEPEVLKIS